MLAPIRFDVAVSSESRCVRRRCCTWRSVSLLFASLNITICVADYPLHQLDTANDSGVAVGDGDDVSVQAAGESASLPMEDLVWYTNPDRWSVQGQLYPDLSRRVRAAATARGSAARVLELGYLPLFNVANAQRLNLDPADEYIAVDLQPRPEPPVGRIIHGDAVTLAWRRPELNRSFDAVTSIGMLGWLPILPAQIPVLLESIARLLKPGAVLGLKLDAEPMDRFSKVFATSYEQVVRSALAPYFGMPPFLNMSDGYGFHFLVLERRRALARQLRQRRVSLDLCFHGDIRRSDLCAPHTPMVLLAHVRAVGTVAVLRRSWAAPPQHWQVVGLGPHIDGGTGCGDAGEFVLAPGDCLVHDARLASVILGAEVAL